MTGFRLHLRFGLRPVNRLHHVTMAAIHVAYMRMPYRPSRRAGAGMSSPRASNWQQLEYLKTAAWPYIKQ